MKLGSKACAGIRDEKSLGHWLVVPFTETGSTEGAEALGQRNRRAMRVLPVSCGHPRGDDHWALGWTGSDLRSVN